MAGLVPAIHDLHRNIESVDARDEPGRDDLLWRVNTSVVSFGLPYRQPQD
jgi:hypothetical protein